MNFEFPKLQSHELVLFFYPSPGLDWSNPKALTFTTIKNSILGRSRSIGHASVMIRTPNEFVFTGMTQSNKKEGRREVLLDGYGLGILLHNFKGALEDETKLLPEITERSREPGKLSYLRILVNEAITSRLLEYVRTYEKEGHHQSYGMKNRPLHGEGGGCSAFAASFLETAGILRDEFVREWTRTFNIPHDFIGGPAAGKKVSVLELLRRAKRWAHDHEPHEKGFFWDPDLMHAWAVRTHELEKAPSLGGFQPEIWNSARGLVYDARDVTPPQGEIFKHRS